MWLCVCCRNGSQGPVWFLQSDHRFPPGPSRRLRPWGWNPSEMSPQCQRIWFEEVHLIFRNNSNEKTRLVEKRFHLLAEQRIQLFRDIVLFVFQLCLSQFNGNVRISLPINVSWMKICGLPNIPTNLKMKCIIPPRRGVVYVNAYPDHIYANEDVNGIVAGNILKHSHAGIIVSWYVIWHFVHAHWALKRTQ